VNALPATLSTPAADLGAALRVAHVSKRFGGVQAVDDVSLTVAPGEAVAVIGPNGAGKSSLLKLLSGVYTPDSGSIHLDEHRTDGRRPEAVARLGVSLAHQVPQPFRGLTVGENVAIGALSSGRRARGSAAAAVQEILHTCGLAAKADLQAEHLRLLDLKRLELARALSTDPSLILLDEVAAGLNGRELDDVIELIRGIHAEGRTLLLVEHVEGVVASLVDRVVVIDWGKVIAEGTPAQVAADPRVREVYLGGGHPSRPATRASAMVAATDAAPAEGPIEPPPVATLQLENVTAAYGDIVALRGVSLQVSAGETVAVLGANGAGKSTLAAVVSGLLRPRQGRVLLDGLDVTAVPSFKRARRGVAHCPEGRRVFADLTIAENLELAAPLRLPREQLQRRRQVVEATFPMLHDMARRRAGALSGGQQQMVAIGRSLMADPHLLVLDEISLGLAPVAIDALYEALEVIRERGIAILLVEQNVHRSLTVADRVYVLERGRITYAGDPAPLTDASTLNEFYFGTSATLPVHPEAAPSTASPERTT